MFISIVVYVIYKEWLALSFENKIRPNIPNMRYFVTEFKWFVKIFEKVNKLNKYTHYIKILVDRLAANE